MLATPGSRGGPAPARAARKIPVRIEFRWRFGCRVRPGWWGRVRIRERPGLSRSAIGRAAADMVIDGVSRGKPDRWAARSFEAVEPGLTAVTSREPAAPGIRSGGQDAEALRPIRAAVRSGRGRCQVVLAEVTQPVGAAAGEFYEPGPRAQTGAPADDYRRASDDRGRQCPAQCAGRPAGRVRPLSRRGASRRAHITVDSSDTKRSGCCRFWSAGPARQPPRRPARPDAPPPPARGTPRSRTATRCRTWLVSVSGTSYWVMCFRAGPTRLQSPWWPLEHHQKPPPRL